MTLATGELGSRQTGNGEMTNTRERALVQDTSQFANLLDTSKFEHLWRVATLFAKTQLVPAHFRGHPEDCFIATSMAIRLGVDPFMFMQNTYIVHGRPGMEAKLAIALINSSGYFQDPLDYEIDGGEDPNGAGYKVRAVATRKSTGKVVNGPWIDWKMVRAEKWNEKEGSKWKTIPGLMFQYRAAAFFGRLHCPERLMGMQTTDELKDTDAREVTSTIISQSPLRPFGPGAVTQHPTDDTRTVDRETSQLSQTEAEEILKNAPRAPDQQDEQQPEQHEEKREIDTGGVEAAPPTDSLPDLDSEGKFIAFAESLASRDQIDTKLYSGAIAKLRVSDGISGGRRKDTETRNKIAAAMQAGAFDWAAGRIVS